MIKISRESEINLINILIDQDVISGKDLIDIKKKSSDGDKSQIDAVFELNLTDEDKILDLLVKEQSLDIADLASSEISDEIKSVLPSNYINMNFIAPFKIEGNVLHIAIPDSSKLSLMRNLKTITKKDIELHAAKLSDISAHIDRLSAEGETTMQSIQQANQEKTKTFDYDVDESAELLDEKPEEDIEAIENESDVIKFSTAVVAEAIKSGVSDIHIEPYRFSSRVRYRLDGILTEQEHFAKFLHSNYGAVVTRFKIMGKLDIAERRLPQDGAIPFKIDGKVVDLRLSILPTATNERIVMRVLNKDAGDISLEQLNFEEQDLKNLRKAIHGTQGLVLVTGPTGSGKTTTLYSILKEVSKPHLNILTAEDPVEYELDGVGQVQIKDDIGYDFQRALRSFLRQDPEIILVGEMRDKETVDIGLKAALTGHLVFSTLHTNDAPSSVARLADMGIKKFLIASAVRAILAQRLVRKLCDKCKVPATLDEKELRALNIDPAQLADSNIMGPGGCEHCRDTGYRGRIGIFEIFLGDDEVRHLINQDLSSPQLRRRARELGMRTLREDGIRKVLVGMTSAAEVIGVTMSDAD